MRVGHFVEQIEVEPDFEVLPAAPDGSPDPGAAEPAEVLPSSREVPAEAG